MKLCSFHVLPGLVPSEWCSRVKQEDLSLCVGRACVLTQETCVTVLAKGTESSLQVPYSLVIFAEKVFFSWNGFLPLSKEKLLQEKPYAFQIFF